MVPVFHSLRYLNNQKVSRGYESVAALKTFLSYNGMSGNMMLNIISRYDLSFGIRVELQPDHTWPGFT